jgi:hypothetical protein
MVCTIEMAHTIVKVCTIEMARTIEMVVAGSARPWHARQHYDLGVSLLRPLYYEHPEDDDAYTWADTQYYFGDSMLARGSRRRPGCSLCTRSTMSGRRKRRRIRIARSASRVTRRARAIR